MFPPHQGQGHLKHKWRTPKPWGHNLSFQHAVHNADRKGFLQNSIIEPVLRGFQVCGRVGSEQNAQTGHLRSGSHSCFNHVQNPRLQLLRNHRRKFKRVWTSSSFPLTKMTTANVLKSCPLFLMQKRISKKFHSSVLINVSYRGMMPLKHRWPRCD